MTKNKERVTPLNVDSYSFVMDSAKRDMDATVWAVALAAPGLFAGLGQVQNLFKASRAPWAFGYVFGTMIFLLLLSIYFGIRNYSRLYSILSVHSTLQNSRHQREAMQEWVLAEWKRETPDRNQIDDYDRRIKASFDASKESYGLLDVLHNPPGALSSLLQRRILEYAYLLFILVLLTSDFSRLL